MATNVVDSAKGQTSLRSFNHKGERMNNSDGQSMTRIDEMVPDIYRISTSISQEVIPGGFSFNQYLIVDKMPLLFHTGPLQLFPAISQAVAKVIPVKSLSFIAFSHFEADECGSLNEWLKVASDAVPLCGQIAAMLSINDIAMRSPKIMSDLEQVSLGKHNVQWLDAPHLPHGWDCGFLFETTSKTLFCGDLFTQPGADHKPVTEEDILESSEIMRQTMDYYAHGNNQRQLFEKLANTHPKVLACMHGSAWKGNGFQLINALADRVCGDV